MTYYKLLKSYLMTTRYNRSLYENLYCTLILGHLDFFPKFCSNSSKITVSNLLRITWDLLHIVHKGDIACRNVPNAFDKRMRRIRVLELYISAFLLHWPLAWWVSLEKSLNPMNSLLTVWCQQIINNIRVYPYY